MKNIIFKIFSLGLAGIIALTPITSHAVVRDNLSSMDTSATATSSDLLNGETAWVNGSKITGTIPSLAAKTYTPGTTNQTITANQFLSGAQTIKGDSNLVSSNIKSGVTIFGVSGNSNVVDTSAGTATAAQVLKDKIAYVDGTKITGTMINNSDTTVTATTVSKSDDGLSITANIPETGYYDTNSKINITIEKKNELEYWVRTSGAHVRAGGTPTLTNGVTYSKSPATADIGTTFSMTFKFPTKVSNFRGECCYWCNNLGINTTMTLNELTINNIPIKAKGDSGSYYEFSFEPTDTVTIKWQKVDNVSAIAGIFS